MDDPKRPRSADRDFLDRLSDLDRNLPVSGEPRPAAPSPADGWDDFAERRRSSATAPRDPRPLLDLFPPVEPDPQPVVEAARHELPAAPGHAIPDKAPDDDAFDEPAQDHLDEEESPRRLAALAATFLIAMAAGATAAAYLFRDDLAAIIAAWQQSP